MARITVEDCLEKIPNRFQLVLAATYRARMLSQGQEQARRDRPARNRRWQSRHRNAQARVLKRRHLAWSGLRQSRHQT